MHLCACLQGVFCRAPQRARDEGVAAPLGPLDSSLLASSGGGVRKANTLVQHPALGSWGPRVHVHMKVVGIIFAGTPCKDVGVAACKVPVSEGALALQGLQGLSPEKFLRVRSADGELVAMILLPPGSFPGDSDPPPGMFGVVHVDSPLASWGGNCRAAFAAGVFRQPGLGANVHDAEWAGSSSSSSTDVHVHSAELPTNKLFWAAPSLPPTSLPTTPDLRCLQARRWPPPPVKAPPPFKPKLCAICGCQPQFHSCNICHRPTCRLPTCMVFRCEACFDDIIQRELRTHIAELENELVHIRAQRGQGKGMQTERSGTTSSMYRAGAAAAVGPTGR